MIGDKKSLGFPSEAGGVPFFSTIYAHFRGADLTASIRTTTAAQRQAKAIMGRPVSAEIASENPDSSLRSE